MNLVTDPWIPVINRDSRHRLVSLRDVFADGENIADLSANPCQRQRHAAARAHRPGGPRRPRRRGRLARLPPPPHPGRARLPGKVAAPLQPLWRTRLLAGGRAGSHPNALADKIDLTLACGSSPTLFDHEATKDGRTHENAILAPNILVYQMFSPGGLVGTALWEHTR